MCPTRIRGCVCKPTMSLCCLGGRDICFVCDIEKMVTQQTLCSHTLHSPTHINIFQNTELFRSCTLNPTGMFPLSHRGKWLTPPHRAPRCPASEICLSDSLLPSSIAPTINVSSSSIYFELIHFISLTHGGNIVLVCVMENSLAPLRHWLILD